MSTLHACDLANFRENGFAVLDRLLDEVYVSEFIRQIESLPANQISDRARRGIVFARRNLLNEAVVQSVLKLPWIAPFAQSISPDAIPVRAILFDKTGGANWTVPWHQDRSIMVDRRVDLPGFGPWSMKCGVVHVQPPVELLWQMFTLRLHLDACAADNGPLRVIAGTQDGILNAGEVEDVVFRGDVIDCTVSAGGFVIMRPLILHSSLPAKAPSHRRVIHIEFGPRELPAPLRWAHEAFIDPPGRVE